MVDPEHLTGITRHKVEEISPHTPNILFTNTNLLAQH